MKDEFIRIANQDKLATGTIGDLSKKMGIKPVYTRTGIVALSLLTNPLIGIGVYGAGYAYNKFKK